MGAQVGFDSAAPPAASPYRARRFTPVQNTYMPSVLFRIGSVLHVVALAGIASFNFPVLDSLTMTSADFSQVTSAITDGRAAVRRRPHAHEISVGKP